jgi:hypothetical protein
VKIAIHQTGPIAGRCAEVLLAERNLTAVGAFDGDPEGSRVSRVDDLGEWDVLVSDSPDPASILRRACAAHIPLVTRVPVSQVVDIPLFPDASLAAIARALTVGKTPSLVATTTRGSRLRQGTRVGFPPPVGTLWATVRPDGILEAPTPDEWGGLLVESASTSIGVADQFDFLEAIALASAAITMTRRTMSPGVVDIASVAGAYLDNAEAAGLEIATFRPARPAHR